MEFNRIVRLKSTPMENLPVAVALATGSLGMPINVGLRNLGGRGSKINARTLQFTEDLSWVHGKHTIQYGGTFRYVPILSVSAFKTGGAFTSWLASLTSSLGLSIPASNRPVPCSASVIANCQKSSDVTA